MWTFKTGDLVSKSHPRKDEDLQIGIVIKDDRTTFLIKWLWYNKEFFMEKEGDIFKDLNKTYILNTETCLRERPTPLLCLLNSIYRYGKQGKNK